MADDRGQITLRIPSDLKEQLQREALDMGVSFNAYLLMLIQAGLRQQ